VNAEAPIPIEAKPRWRRRLAVMARRYRLARFLEGITILTLLVIVACSYWVIRKEGAPGTLLTPGTVALLMVANLVPAMALMVLVARRVAMRRAARSPIGGRGRLHVRLVALFSVIASVPTLIVVIFASLLFQYGVQFWYSREARAMLGNASSIAHETYQRETERVAAETVTMSGDLGGYLKIVPMDSRPFAEYLAYQVYNRNLSEAMIVAVTPQGGIQSLALVNPYDRDLGKVVTPQMIAALQGQGGRSLTVNSSDRIGAFTHLPYRANTYLYASRVFDPHMAAQVKSANAIVRDYDSLLIRARTLQFRVYAALLVISLLIVGFAIWVALVVADRLVRPVGQLVDAARRVTAGDMSARVPPSPVRDEVGTLGNAFNRMTKRLEEQTGALMTANAQSESRRAFIEAVLSGVTAGIISVDKASNVRLMNSSAATLLKTDRETAVGQKLAALAPELADHLDSEEREGIVQLASGGEHRTLAVKKVRVETGFVLTFDDITEQLLDQRRAAWSDVARRIAHEIKNPLTPIQLAAERLQRRYSKEIESDPATFDQLTGTIVRQVGDLRRMVDEFSSFARMPKPVFRDENIVEIARQALFLHEVAHPEIKFSLDAPEPPPMLVCDRRQLGQALTNIVKNAVEAIDQKPEESRGGSEIAMTIREDGSQLIIEIADTGIGLPSERGRLTEPYMTTRAKGTGLGLAIVKKIVEEHMGTIDFEDRAGGGSLVRLVFDKDSLSRLASDGAGALHDQAVSG
jgi:two-component system nitrogen regulation sensor histidine kinase NtrY